jgi:Zn-dependent M16 (insulinase) family peptidase
LREEGGAYGGGATNNTISGNFSFYSYRDPHIFNSLQAFEEAIRSIANGEFDEDDLEEAKREMIQSFDDVIAPGSRGDYAYGWLREGKTQEQRQAFRTKLLGLTGPEVIEAIQKHIVSKFSTGSTVVFAGKELLEKENTALVSAGKLPLILESV